MVTKGLFYVIHHYGYLPEVATFPVSPLKKQKFGGNMVFLWKREYPKIIVWLFHVGYYQKT